MTMGTGGDCVKSRKHKLNTNISTDAYLAGVNDVPTQVIWNWYFLKYQGYKIHYNIIYQDKRSGIKLEKNGRRLIRNRKRHINIRYYFISDRITKQEASVEWCPTMYIIKYYFTKALQGSQFRCFCNIIIGIHEYEIPAYNASRRALHEEGKLKLKEEKEWSHKTAKITGELGNQGVCWAKYISGSLLTGY